MNRGARLAVLALLVAPALATATTGPAADAAGDAPEGPWWVRTMLDLDRDGLDDALAPLLRGQDPLVVLVAYERHPGAAERARVEALGGEVTFAPAHFPLLAVRAGPDAVDDLARLPGVVLVERNDDLRPLLAQSVPLVGAPQAWSTYGATGKGVTVAILDDGAFEQHPDFKGKIAASYNAAVGGSPLPADRSDVVVPAGEEGHGTHVAGTIAGTGGESGGRYKGVAPDARFVNVGVFTGPNRTSSDVVLRGLDWVLSNRGRLGIAAAQLSLGGRPSDGTDALSRGVDIAVDEGLVVVAAVGNAGPDPKTVSSPGAAEKAITVGAVDKQKRVVPFSSRGPTLDGRAKPDLVAPGRDIVSTVPPHASAGGLVGGSATVYYGSLSGTSMAAPHVAGVVALMLQANPDLSPHEVKRILLATAQDLGPRGRDNDTGYGFVNGLAAVQVARNPSLLQSAEFRSILATIPEPQEESFMERLQYRMERLERDGLLQAYALVLLLAFAGVVGGAVALARRRAGGDPSSPPAPPPPGGPPPPPGAP